MTVVNDIAEIIWTAEQELTGHFDAAVGRRQAKTLVEDGFTMNPEKEAAAEHDVFFVLITIEEDMKGVFHAHVARKIARKLVALGITQK